MVVCFKKNWIKLRHSLLLVGLILECYIIYLILNLGFPFFFCEELLVDLLSKDDVSGAVQFFSSMVDELVYITEKVGNLNVNDYIKIAGMKGGKLIKELKHVEPRSAKQLLHKVKLSVLLTKLL